MNWKDISVFQWQQIDSVIKKKDNYTDEEISIKVLCIVYNKTENQIKNLSINEFNNMTNSLSFLASELKPESKEYIYCGKKRYRFNYDVNQMNSARYIEAKYFLKDFETNIHKIAASMVIPQKWTFTGYKDCKYDSKKHEEYSNDLLKAPITDVLGSVVFFYLIYNNWIKNSKDSLMKQMMEMGMEERTSEYLYQTLLKISDGFIKQVSLPNLNESNLKKFTNYLQFNF